LYDWVRSAPVLPPMPDVLPPEGADGDFGDEADEGDSPVGAR